MGDCSTQELLTLCGGEFGQISTGYCSTLESIDKATQSQVPFLEYIILEILNFPLAIYIDIMMRAQSTSNYS